MATTITWNGTAYSFPAAGEVDWDAKVLAIIQAIAGQAAVKTVTTVGAATVGSATLVGGTVTVATTGLANSSTSKVIPILTAEGGTPGRLRVSAKVTATSFTVTSSSATDTSTFDWVIINA